MTKHVPYLDGWRGLAILGVLLHHFGPPGHGWLGLIGVYLFFVLSGVLMSQLLFIKRVPLSTFFMRRISRVLPTFWLFVVAMAIYAAFFQPTPYLVPVSEFLFTLTFMRTYFPIGADIWADQWAIGHVWSLNIEEHSYIFLAIGALACRQGGRAISAVLFLIVSAATVLCINFFYQAYPNVVGSPWYLFSQSGSLGLLSAAALCVVRRVWKRSEILCPSPWLPMLSFVLALVCCSTYSHRGVDRTVAPLCLAYSVVFLDRVPEFFRRCLSLRLLRWFGTCSFSLYLWQHPFYLSIGEAHSNRAWMAALAIATGALSFYAFEDPIRQAMNRAWTLRVSRRATVDLSHRKPEEPPAV